jgi:hypothetical protein
MEMTGLKKKRSFVRKTGEFLFNKSRHAFDKPVDPDFLIRRRLDEERKKTKMMSSKEKVCFKSLSYCITLFNPG